MLSYRWLFLAKHFILIFYNIVPLGLWECQYIKSAGHSIQLTNYVLLTSLEMQKMSLLYCETPWDNICDLQNLSPSRVYTPYVFRLVSTEVKDYNFRYDT